MNIAGIDVGLSGAIAILNNQSLPLELQDMPVIRAVKNEIDVVELIAILKRQNVSHVFIEKADALLVGSYGLRTLGAVNGTGKV